MRSIKIIIVVLLMLSGGVSFSAEDRSSGYDKYKVIYEQNMFSKNRRPPQQERRRRQVETTKVMSIYVLRGIAAEAGRANKVAFVEEQISGQSQTVNIGATILNGQIKDIQMNYVLFEEDGKIRKIGIGQEFGTTSTTVVTEVEGSPDEIDTTSESTEEKTDDSSSTDDDDMLKKLMERRKRELGT